MNQILPLRRAARITLATSLFVLAIKFIAFFVTGSKAVLSDAIESIINVVTGTFLVLSINISTQPVDEDHPYGHGKIEAFSAGLEGGLIVLACIMIFVEAVPAFFVPEPPQNLGKGIFILVGAGVVNLFVGMYLIHSGKKHKSEALEASGKHLLTDFYTSVGVLIGLVLVRFSGTAWLDPLVACLVAIHIFIPGMKLVNKSTKNLMNEADPEFLNKVVSGLNRIRKPGWLFPHKLRSIRSGRYHHVDLHISFPHYWSLSKVHDAEEELTRTLLDAINEEGDIMIHVDPCVQSYCPSCSVDQCPQRTSDVENTAEWTVQGVVSEKPCFDTQEKKKRNA